MTVMTHDGDITAEPEVLENIFLAYSNAASSLRKLGETEKAIHFMDVSDDIFYALQQSGRYENDPFLCDIPDLRRKGA